MLDRAAYQLFSPLMERMARVCVRHGIGADSLTLGGFGLGLAGAVAIALNAYLTGLLLICLSRLCDGVDGSVARLTQPTDRGAFLDTALDFLFYATVPLAFAWANPATNALPAAVLLCALIGSSSSYLAFAILATKRGLPSLSYPGNSFYFLGCLTETTETLGVFICMCLWPVLFPALAYTFAAATLLTSLTRLLWGWKTLS